MRLPAKSILKQAEVTSRAIDRAFHNPVTCPYDEYTIEQLEELQVQCSQFRWAHPLRLREVRADRLDRCAPLLGGALFTSEEYPWMGDEGYWLEPIAQIDLRVVGKLAGVELGEGLLQLWMEDVEGQLRVVPFNALQRRLLTPPPDNLSEDNYDGRFNDSIRLNRSRYKGFRSLSYTDPVPVWRRSAYAITGVRPPVLSRPPMLEIALNSAVGCDLRPGLRATIEKLTRFMSLDWPSTEPHYFGNFDCIQYDVIDKPPTLLALESNGIFYWGDMGNAQIFYELSENGEVTFSTEYSCQ